MGLTGRKPGIVLVVLCAMGIIALAVPYLIAVYKAAVIVRDDACLTVDALSLLMKRIRAL